MAVRTEEEMIKLSFPQRYWLLLCILVAIISPIVVNWLNATADRVAYRQATEVKQAPGSGADGSAPSSGTVSGASQPATGDSAAKR
jgi:hypothetical protein